MFTFCAVFLESSWKKLVQEYRNVTLVVADGLPVQLNLLSQNYAHGLVAQLPYEMGVKSVDTLLALRQAMEAQEAQGVASPKVPTDLFPDFMGTNVLEHLQIPLVLPELIVNQNHLGHLSIIGFVLFGIIFITAVGSAGWAWTHRHLPVVKIAQPGFLVMVAAGSIVMGSTLIPLSFDDSGASYNERRGIIICMSIPWLAFLGFTITFSALLAKTWRVNQLFQNRGQFQRLKVTAGQVARPFLVMFAANTLMLTLWTILDPLHYVRLDMPGTDAWNRVIATYGSCRSENATPYVSVLGVLNLLVLGVANWQAYRARNINSDFSEAQYIGVAMASMLQASLIGVPLLILVNDMPQAFYLTLVFMLFTVTMVILLLIFVPKIAFATFFKQQSQKSQRRIIQESIHDVSAISRVESSWNTHTDRSAALRARPPRVTFAGDSSEEELRRHNKAMMCNTTVADFKFAAQEQQKQLVGTSVEDFNLASQQQQPGIPAENAKLVDAENGLIRKDSSDSSDSIDVSSAAIGSAFDDEGQMDSWRASLDLAKQMQNFSREIENDQMQRSNKSSISFGSRSSLQKKQASGSSKDDDPMQRSQRSSVSSGSRNSMRGCELPQEPPTKEQCLGCTNANGMNNIIGESAHSTATGSVGTLSSSAVVGAA